MHSSFVKLFHYLSWQGQVDKIIDISPYLSFKLSCKILQLYAMVIKTHFLSTEMLSISNRDLVVDHFLTDIDYHTIYLSFSANLKSIMLKKQKVLLAVLQLFIKYLVCNFDKVIW